MDQVFASLAHIRILLLPVGSIPRPSFEKWAAELREFDEIRLSDVPADSRDDRARFMPNPLATGSLLLSFTRHPPPPSHSSLDLFRPSDFPLGVVGIASCSQSDALSTIYSQFTGSLAELFSSSSMFPLAQNCFVFEDGDGNTNLNIGNHLPGLVIIPSMMGNKKLYIGTLLAELCSNILSEFSVMVKTLESPSGSDSLNAGLFASLPDYKNTRMSVDGHEDYRPPRGIAALHNLPEIGGNGSIPRQNDPSRFTLKRASTLGPGVIGTSSRNTQLLVPLVTKKRQSGVGAGTAHARLYKVLGDLFLLAGRTMDASIWYNEAVHHLKQPQDMPWQAAALEGMAVAGVLETWSANNAFSASSQAKESLTDFSEKLSRAITLYSGAADVVDSEGCISNLSFLYVTACLRHSSLLYSVWMANGWTLFAFNVLLHGEASIRPPSDSNETSITVHSDLKSAVTGICRSDISAILAQVHGPWLLHLGSRERIETLRCIAGMYSNLQFRRKEAYILRELLACLMDLVILGREEARGPIEPAQDIHDASNQFNGHGSVGIREKDDVAGNVSMLRLVRYICGIHGIDLDSVKFADDGDSNTARLSRSSLSDPLHPSQSALKARYMWPELQIGMIREALAVAEALPDYPAVATFALSSLRSLYSLLDPEDQFHFYTASARAMATMRRRGDERKLEYWLAEIVVSITFVSLPFIRLPIERPWSDFLHVQPEGDNEPNVTLDPFLYNPRRMTTSKLQAFAVANEVMEFNVTLENPYSVVLEVLQASLSTTGVPFIGDPVHVVIQPKSCETITLSGRATEAGTLIIRGCTVQLPGVEPHETLLPISTEEEEEKQLLRSIAHRNECERVKSPFLNDRLDKERHHTSAVPSEKENKTIIPSKYLELKVVPEQPFLRVRRTSLTNGAVMLYDGETSVVRLTVENISVLPIDFIELSFDDSTKGYFERTLNDGDLNAFDTYETEYSLVHKPVFSWEPEKNRKEIPPGKESAIFVKCFGKAGCTDGTVQLSYSYAYRRQSSLQAPPAVFYARQLLFPIAVSVYRMLECSGMNILPISALEFSDKGVDNKDWRALLKGVDEFEWCLLTLDVQNTYGLPFEVTLSYDAKVSTSRVVPPGSNYKFLLPIKRFSLPSSVTTEPIPSLTNRQFVVTGLAGEEYRAQRELFWHREELLRHVQATWKEAASSRMGELSLRQQRFTQPMLNALRTEDIRVRLLLTNPGNEATVSPVGSTGMTYTAAPNRYVSVTTRVQNSSLSPLVLSLTLNAEPADHLVYSGMLKNIPLGRLSSQESTEYQAVVVFMAQGQFTITAQVRTVAIGQEAKVCGTGSLVVISQDPHESDGS